MAFNETVFVTGFPGFLATRLVKRLARDGAQFLLLVQPQFLQIAQQVIHEITGETETAASAFRVIEGDITEPNLGLSAEAFALSLQQTTTIFHLAAIYDLAVDSALAAHVNVEGTLNVTTFAKSVRNLKRYHHI